MTFSIRLRSGDPAFVRVLAHFAPAPCAFLLAIFVGVFAVLLQVPVLFFAPLFLVSALTFGIPIAFKLALPITFIALPLSAIVCGKHPIARRFVLPAVGLITGDVFTYLHFSRGNPIDNRIFVFAGTLAGLAAGLYFARKTRQLYSSIDAP